MEEVATGKVTGEEEYWSHTDLWDFAANVKGAQVAFEDVKPILERTRPGAGEDADAALRRASTGCSPSSATATATASTPISAAPR